MQASELVELGLSKLEFLEVTKKGLSKLQILLVELEVRLAEIYPDLNTCHHKRRGENIIIKNVSVYFLKVSSTPRLAEWKGTHNLSTVYEI